VGVAPSEREQTTHGRSTQTATVVALAGDGVPGRPVCGEAVRVRGGALELVVEGRRLVVERARLAREDDHVAGADRRTDGAGGGPDSLDGDADGVTVAFDAEGDRLGVEIERPVLAAPLAAVSRETEAVGLEVNPVRVVVVVDGRGVVAVAGGLAATARRDESDRVR